MSRPVTNPAGWLLTGHRNGQWVAAWNGVIYTTEAQARAALFADRHHGHRVDLYALIPVDTYGREQQP